MKKVLSAFLTLVLLVSCCLIAATPASAAEVEINYDDFDIVDGVIIEYLGDGGEVIVPSIDADGNEITRIDSRAFYGNRDVTAVYICEGITEIGNECFEGCVQLGEVSLPYSLETFGSYSPFRKTSLASLIVPGNVKEIPSDLVVGVGVEDGGTGVSFSDLVISPGVEVIKAGAIYCAAEEFIIPDSVYKIEGNAWNYVKKEISIYICNPDCEVGIIEEERAVYKPNSTENFTYTGEMPIALVWDSQATVKVYSAKTADGIKEKVNYWKDASSPWGGGNFQFIGVADDKLAEKNEWCEKNGTNKPTKWTMNADGSVEGEEDKKTDKNDKKEDKDDKSEGIDTTLIIILAAVLLFVIIIAVVVVVVVTSSNKKKKKKKKKKAAPKAEPEAEVETENLEEAEEADEE